MKLTRHGSREMLVASAALLAACALLGWLSWRVSWLLLAPLAVPAALWGWVVLFFRDPDRLVPREVGLFVAPADGRVTDVTPLDADSPLGCEGLQVGIFMSIFNVHVNRNPCDGRVERIEHRDGAFLDVRRREAWQANESATIHLRHVHGGREFPVVLRQVAGLIARRIVTDLAEGQEIQRGRRMGMVKFGSRLELMVPRELVGAVRVVVGQRTRAGVTVLIAAPTAARK